MSQPVGIDTPQPFGEFLRDAIKDAGFKSASAFAREAGIDPSNVLRWIKGTAKPEASSLEAVAPLLKRQAAELIAAAYPSTQTAFPAGALRHATQVAPTRDADISTSLQPGANLLVGENNHGKSAVFEAIRAQLFDGRSSTEPVNVEPEFQTEAGLATWVGRRDDPVLVGLMHRAGLDANVLHDVAMWVRARQAQQDRELREELAAELRSRGGRGPDQPTEDWLLEARAAEKKIENFERCSYPGCPNRAVQVAGGFGWCNGGHVPAELRGTAGRVTP